MHLLIRAPITQDRVLLEAAAELGRVECVSVLLSTGPGHLNRVYDGFSPLHEAALRGRADCVVLLLRAWRNDKAKHSCFDPNLTASVRNQNTRGALFFAVCIFEMATSFLHRRPPAEAPHGAASCRVAQAHALRGGASPLGRLG